MCFIRFIKTVKGLAYSVYIKIEEKVLKENLTHN